MYLRDMPEARQRVTTGSAVKVGCNHCPPRGCSPSDPRSISSSQAELFCYKAPREAPSAAAGVPAAAVTHIGIDQAKTIGVPDPMLLSPAPALHNCMTWGKAWAMQPS